jgi:hypothetical protein
VSDSELTHSISCLCSYFHRNCAALYGLNHLGPEGYHWRVCVEDRPVPGAPAETKATFSWWDVQDENSTLPIKEASQSSLNRFFAPPKNEDYSDSATKAAKGAFKTLGKAMSHAVSGTDGIDHGPPVSVIAFKLLDLVKMHDDFNLKHHGRGEQISTPQPRAPRPAPVSAPRTSAPPARPAPNVRASAPPPRPQHTPAPSSHGAPVRRYTPQQPAAEASLMDFGAPVGAPAGRSKVLHHAVSSPPNFNINLNANESRAEKLKREYAEKHQNSNRVWDDIDQRWVEVDATKGPTTRGTTSAPPGSAHSNRPPAKKEIGISLDPANAVGKAAHVQAAVNQRVDDMKKSQQKALQELQERDQKQKASESEEDEARKRLEPKIKAWSEEHGKKKQLRALLGSLQLILWPGAEWKVVTLGDILDNSKCKRCYHKASRVVHPDKTHHLKAEERFLAKRIFDALSQAKTEFDNNG